MELGEADVDKEARRQQMLARIQARHFQRWTQSWIRLPWYTRWWLPFPRLVLGGPWVKRLPVCVFQTYSLRRQPPQYLGSAPRPEKVAWLASTLALLWTTGCRSCAAGDPAQKCLFTL